MSSDSSDNKRIIDESFGVATQKAREELAAKSVRALQAGSPSGSPALTTPTTPAERAKPEEKSAPVPPASNHSDSDIALRLLAAAKRLPPRNAYEAMVRDSLQRHEEWFIHELLERPGIIGQAAADALELFGLIKAAPSIPDYEASKGALRDWLQLFRDYYGRHLILFCESQNIDSGPLTRLMTSPSAAVLKEAEALVERIFALASLSVAQQDTKDNKPPERVELTAAERAMVVYLRDPNQSIREIAHQVGCDPSLLYRDERLKRLREAHKGKVPKGTKSKEGDLEAEAED